MTAPRFNYSYKQTNLTYSFGSFSESSPAQKSASPPAIRKIVIVGGGSSGWMAAMIFANAFIKRGIEITLLESPAVGIIGVGEGSTPWLRGFFDSLDIEESEWMPEVNATYKCGITFDKWSTRPGFESYFHPFASMLDNLTLGMFIHNVEARLNGADVYAHPNRFFIATRLAESCMAPKPSHNFPFDIWYGYHFDAVLLGQYLHKKAEARGVKYKSCHVADVKLNERGDIAAVTTKEGETIAADFFVDCTGFAGVLIQKALGTPFIPFANNLFNDSAIAMPTPMDEKIPSQTVSTAMRHGWKWKIPLTSRYGNGYVYSSAFCSADEAERELRESLGLLGSDTPARHLKMKTGRCTKHCERAQERFNQRLNEHFEGTRDYIVTHYKTNSRTDTEYWRANAANMNLSDSLKQLYSMWTAGKSIAADVGRQAIGKGYPIFSWYSIMSGMGLFPAQRDLRPAPAGRAYDMAEIDNLLERSALNFRDQREVLGDIPKKRKESAMQIYFW